MVFAISAPVRGGGNHAITVHPILVHMENSYRDGGERPCEMAAPPSSTRAGVVPREVDRCDRHRVAQAQWPAGPRQAAATVRVRSPLPLDRPGRIRQPP
jgi:hypothetical protein